MKRFVLFLVLCSFLLLNTGCGNQSIVGKWKSYDTKDSYYYIFHLNHTCSYEMKNARLDCTYDDDGEILTILYKGNTNKSVYTYHFEKNTLIIQDESHKNHIFIKVEKN